MKKFLEDPDAYAAANPVAAAPAASGGGEAKKEEKKARNAGKMLDLYGFIGNSQAKHQCDFMGYIEDVLKCQGTVLGVLFCGSFCALNWMVPLFRLCHLQIERSSKKVGNLSATMSIYIYTYLHYITFHYISLHYITYPQCIP